MAIAMSSLVLLSAGLLLPRGGMPPPLEPPPAPMIAVKQRLPVISVEASATPVAMLTPKPTAKPGVQAPAAPHELPETTSLDVVHQHRLGGCRGRLTVTRNGVMFVTTDGDADGFTLKHTEFLHALTDDTLTLKSATKTYRFKVAESQGGTGDAVQLREIADRIARWRR